MIVTRCPGTRPRHGGAWTFIRRVRFSYRSNFWRYRRYSRSTTTVRCIRVETTTASSACPRTASFPWNGQCGSAHARSGTGTSIPMSRADDFSFFSAFAILGHRAFLMRSSGRKRISSPSTSAPPGTSNRNREPCFATRFSRPAASMSRVFLVSSTTTPATPRRPGASERTISTRRPMSSGFRRFISDDPHGVAHPLEDGLDLVAVLSLKLDPALLRGSARRAAVLEEPCELVEIDVRAIQPVDNRHHLPIPARVRVDADPLLFLRELLAHAQLVREPAGGTDPRHQPVSSFAGTGFAAAPAPNRSSSCMTVRMRAMFFRSARILPGLGGAPPIAATPP